MCLETPSCISAICELQGLSIRLGGERRLWQREMETMPEPGSYFVPAWASVQTFTLCGSQSSPTRTIRSLMGTAFVGFSHQLTAGAVSCSWVICNCMMGGCVMLGAQGWLLFLSFKNCFLGIVLILLFFFILSCGISVGTFWIVFYTSSSSLFCHLQVSIHASSAVLGHSDSHN